MISKDGSCKLIPDIDASNLQGSYIECVSIDFGKVDPATTAILLYLDGGPRQYSFVQNLNIYCVKIQSERDEISFCGNSGQNMLFQVQQKPRRDALGYALLAVYKDGWFGNFPRFASKIIFEPSFVSTAQAKTEVCNHIIIANVSSLDKFSKRLFGSVREMCMALTSHSLPTFKKSFQKAGNRLDLLTFTSVVFSQLYESHPAVASERESAYAVAMIEEMFNQVGKFMSIVHLQ
jgi:hypothetical protein